MKKIILIISLILGSVLTISCGNKAFVKGQYDQDINQANLLTDKWSETDMQKAVSDLIGSIKKHPSIARAKRPPVVMVTRLKNRTSEHIETKSIMDMLRVELMRGGDVVFVDREARGDMAEEYDYQKDNASRETMKKRGNQTGTDYIINGRLDSIVQQAGRDKTVYYKLTLNLSNLRSGIIEWSDYKQIRKIYKKTRVGM